MWPCVRASLTWRPVSKIVLCSSARQCLVLFIARQQPAEGVSTFERCRPPCGWRRGKLTLRGAWIPDGRELRPLLGTVYPGAQTRAHSLESD